MRSDLAGPLLDAADKLAHGEPLPRRIPAGKSEPGGNRNVRGGGDLFCGVSASKNEGRGARGWVALPSLLAVTAGAAVLSARCTTGTDISLTQLEHVDEDNTCGPGIPPHH